VFFWNGILYFHFYLRELIWFFLLCTKLFLFRLVTPQLFPISHVIEIVLGQESQILPAFIIVLDPELAHAAMEKWNRILPSEKCAPVARALPSQESAPSRFSVVVKQRRHSLAHLLHGDNNDYEIV
jgi:hypothetical protein